jgi:hypothetical protein
VWGLLNIPCLITSANIKYQGIQLFYDAKFDHLLKVKIDVFPAPIIEGSLLPRNNGGITGILVLFHMVSTDDPLPRVLEIIISFIP